MVWLDLWRPARLYSNLFLVLLLLSTGFLAGPASESEDPMTFMVDLPGLQDHVVLIEDDPRTPRLSETAPDPAQGLYKGSLEGIGWPLHLVQTDTLSLGVLATPTGAQWVTVESGIVVPFILPEQERPEFQPGEAIAPAGTTATGPSGPQEPVSTPDRVLQIRLDGDQWFHSQHLEAWQEVQLMVIHLVSAVYEANLGFSFEVVGQHVWTDEDPQPWGAADKLCQGGGEDPLPGFRSYWESRLPTTLHAHEASHLFSGNLFSGATIGCAYIRQLDTSAAYGVSQVRWPVQNPSLYRSVVLVSHEIGHNFNGVHSQAWGSGCTGGSIMYPTLCQNSPVFSGTESLTACRAGLDRCTLVSQGNAQRMWSYASDRI